MNKKTFHLNEVKLNFILLLAAAAVVSSKRISSDLFNSKVSCFHPNILTFISLNFKQISFKHNIIYQEGNYTVILK